MIEIKGKHVCENCFEETEDSACLRCGYAPGESAKDPSMLAPGSILLGKYIVGQVIGKGGFGITYLAYDTLKSRKVAIKEYFPYGIARRAAESTKVSVISPINSEAFELGAEKFYEESKLVSRFNGSPNIVNVYEFFYENDTVYLVMEYLRGITLKEYIRDNGIITAPQALYIARHVAAALSIAHDASVLHRDISPDNIILCDDGGVKLIDFGSARQLLAEHSQNFSVILKPGFAPPEQYQKKGNQGPWTDIYSLGATLYFALTGDIPEDPVSRFDDDDTFKCNQFGIAGELWEVISRATKLKTEERFADIHEMESALSKIPFEPKPIIAPKDPNDDPDAEPRTSAPFGLNGSRSSGNYKQHINFTSEPKKSFLAAHKRAVISTGCLAVAAAIIISVTLNKPDVTDDSSGSLSGESPTASDTISDGETAEPDPNAYLFNLPDYKTKFYYTTLDEEGKQLYEKIYNCIYNVDIKLDFPERVKSGFLSEVYFKVLYDNPQFCYAQDFTSIYYDLNGNNITDDDEEIEQIRPYYFTETSSKAESYMLDVLKSCDYGGDMINNLRIAHDSLITKAQIVTRYANATCTSAHGPLVNKLGDDVGFAKAFCFYAQALGLQCYVIDGKIDGELRAWCRVELDGTWYNVDVYGDKLAGDLVTQMEITPTDKCFHTFFLTNDEYIKARGYTQSPKYVSVWADGYAADSPEKNLYLARGNEFYFDDPDAAYEHILAVSAKLYVSGELTSECCTAPYAVDALCDEMNRQFLSDLSEKHGITLSGFSAKYFPDSFSVTLKK